MEEKKNIKEEDDLIKELLLNYPNEVNENSSLLNFLALIFLKFRKNDLNSANKRLKNYLQWRREIFHSLEEQNIENDIKLKTQIESLFLTILPYKTNNGEAIVYLELKRHNTYLYSAEDTVKAWHYHIMCALRKDPELATNGFYMTGNMSNISYSNLDIQVPHTITHALSNCMPVRICQFFIIHPPYIAQLVIPVVKMLLSSKLSQRLNIIHDVSTLQTEFQLPSTCLPEVLGGTITEEMHIRLIDQLIVENMSV